MATGEQFPYKIVATENNNIINGFAYTFDSEATKTSINGKVDKLNRKLTFKETGIISTRTVITQAFMCLINASLELKGDVLTGRIASKQADNTACTEGTLTFRNKEELTQLFSSHDKYDQVITMGGKHKGNPVPLQENPSTISVNTVPEKITAGVEKSYDWNADSVVAEVWDGGIMDGDVVTILFDGRPVLDHYTIQKQKRRLVLQLPAGGVHSFVVVAENEGSEPPNTATLMLYDGSAHYSLIAYNTKGQKSLIWIKKVK